MKSPIQKLLRALSCGALATSAICHGGEGRTGPATVTLDTIPEKVRAMNLSLAAARYRIEEARGRLHEAGRLSNPALESQYKGNTRSNERSIEVGLAQSFPVTARLRLEKEVSQAEVHVAEAEVRDVERLLIARAERAAIEFLALREGISLRQKESALSNQLADFIAGAAAKGEGSALDAGQARLESTQLELDIRQLEAAATEALGELKPLLGLPANAALTVNGSLPAPALPSPAPVNPDNRPDYQAAILSTEAAAREIALARANRYEDVAFGVFVEGAKEEDAPLGVEGETIVGFKFSIPLPLWKKNEGAIREKTAKRQRLEKESEALANGIRNEAATARAQMIVQADLVREIDTSLLPLATRQVELGETAYRDGQGDLQSILRARDQTIKLESARLMALKDFHLARIRFETAISAHHPETR